MPASRCPWCNRCIMVICANCRRYADDSRPTCEHCGALLEEHDRSELTKMLGVEPVVAELAADQQRALLIASGVVARNVPHFFFDDGRRRTVLVELLGSPSTPRRTAAALLFSAVAYLVSEGYCQLALSGPNEDLRWEDLRPWKGQTRSLEGMLAARAMFDETIDEALHQAVRKAMGFGYEQINPPLVRMPGVPKMPLVQDRSERSALRGIIEISEQAALPEYDQSRAEAQIYGSIRSFVSTDPQRSRDLVDRIGSVLDWFAEFHRDPAIVLLRDV
ncbi:MAG: hypothetical protein PVI59_00560 [Anaerolineae bacterium]